SAKRRAIACPMPRPAPVTTATRSWSSPISSSLSRPPGHGTFYPPKCGKSSVVAAASQRRPRLSSGVMAELAARGGRRILIIEDDLQIRTILERYLSAKGFGVLTAADGLEGIRRFSSERPDIVLLDMLLPKLLGSDVCDMVKRSIEGSGVPVVMMSAVMKPE